MSLKNDDDDEDMIEPKSYCTFAVTGPKVWWQSIYVCRDCEEEGALQCICEACADTCHEDHDIEYIGMGPAYCDCGGGCKISRQSQIKAKELNIAGLNEPEKDDQIIEAQTFRIAGLEGHEACQLVIQQASALTEFPRDTYWIDAKTGEDGDLCELERLALRIFHQHSSMHQLKNLAGAEWWVQVKDLSTENAAVDLHYDKDENLAEKFGLGYFPILSTVTYLTEQAYPTLVFPHRHDEPEDEQMESMIVSHPRRGKHLVFDGRLLHGAPACQAMSQNAAESQPAGIRVTFLVNLWQHSKPCGINVLEPKVRDAVKQSVESLEAKQVAGLDMEKEAISSLEVKNEEELPEEYRDRIELPFVSKGATWVDDDDEGANLVLVTFPPSRHESDTVNVKFGPGMQAYLDYQEYEEEYEEETQNGGPDLEEYV